MPIIKVYHNGVTAGRVPMKNNHKRAKRGEVTGWSAVAARNNIKFLRSVRPDSLTGVGYSVTLTIRDCPETANDWHKLRRIFIKRLERRGLIRLHWVTEWQTRGVPHLHAAAFFREGAITKAEIIRLWCDCASEYVCSPRAQHVGDLPDVMGWFKYLSKHAARGHLHYQRNADAIPEGWKKTGRVWGYVGDWQTDEAVKLDVSDKAFYAYRRIIRAWRKAQAREPIHPKDMNGKTITSISFVDGKRVKKARQMLRCSDTKISKRIGLSEWISEEMALRIIEFLASEGYTVTN